jgi:cell division transport system permease protein
MLLTKLKRIFRAGFFNFWRNGTVSLASVMVLMITLIVIGLVIFSGALLESALQEIRGKVDVTVTFITTSKEEDVLSIRHSLESLPEVALITYTSSAEVLERFRERHSNDQSILAALDELSDNPLGPMLNIRARDPSQYAAIADFLESRGALSRDGVTIIDRVNYFQNKLAIDRLTSIIDTADKVSAGLAILFILVSILIALNTIRLTIYIARDEVAVMRLVGASTAYIQGPFVVVGIIYGIVAGILALILFLPITYWLGEAMSDFFIEFNFYLYYLRHFPIIFLIIIGSGIFIGAGSSALAIRRYLKF